MDTPTPPADAPDLVLLLTDQERAAPAYESHSLSRWREQALPARRWFREHGVSFERHYVGATACVPSRASLLTGQYPDVHGVSQTSGIGKEADDPRTRWLRPGEVPTLGHWMRAAGYDTHYEGKWHVSDADLRDPKTGHALRSNDAQGQLREGVVAQYEKAQCLEPFGFSGWLGPEPHGAPRANSGLVRDRITADRAVRWLGERHRRRQAGDPSAQRPYCLVVCFVNPHDIVFWPLWAMNSPLGPDPQQPPPLPEAPTQYEDLRDKPATQAAYRQAYYSMYGPPRLVRAAYELRAAEYRKTYMRLHLEVDRHIDRVRRTVLSGPRADQTLLLLSSDHGELLGSHGGLHQKWLNLYDESVRVPFILAHTGAFGPRAARVADQLSSHVDLLPTLLAMAGANEAQLRERLGESHSEVHALVGRDLSPLLRGEASNAERDSVYLMTRDNVAEGAEERSLGARARGRDNAEGLALMALPAYVASNLEALVGWHGGRAWKLVRTFDDPATWTEPGVRCLSDRGRAGRRYRSTPIPDAWELYDLTQDPAEAHNRAGDADCAQVMQAMAAMLSRRRQQCLPPRNQPWPYASLPPVAESSAPARRGRDYSLERVRRLNVPREQVWACLADFANIADWYGDALHSSLLTEQQQGVGTERRVQLTSTTLVERVVRWEAPGALAYDLEGLPGPLLAARNHWCLRQAGADTEVRLRMELSVTAGARGRLAYGAVLKGLLGKSLETLIDDLGRRATAGQ